MLELQLAEGRQALVTDFVIADLPVGIWLCIDPLPAGCSSVCSLFITERNSSQLRRIEEVTFCPVAQRCVGRMLKAGSIVSTFPGVVGLWGVLWRLPNSKADAHLPASLSLESFFVCLFSFLFFFCLRLCSAGHQFWKTHASFFCQQAR